MNFVDLRVENWSGNEAVLDIDLYDINEIQIVNYLGLFMQKRMQ